MDTLPTLALFVVSATITPGPNNIMVMASGANFGFRRSLPHLSGVATGVLGITLSVGLGLMAVFDMFPVLEQVLLGVSAVYLLWLAWKIANTMPTKAKSTAAHPLTFVQAATFQVVNPKIWAIGLSAITLYAPERSLASTLLVASSFAAAGLASNAIWTSMGTTLRHWLAVGQRFRAFNIAMALLLVASLYPLLFR
ncbi:LysE family translocator [Acuticoccus mangrovi]|nr:LysE family translocator [Acuticoccus mangrovi]